MTSSELNSYDKIIVAFSGGKDSLACLLDLLDNGADKNKIELWHHDVDGKDDHFMDWKITPAYCREVAKAFDLPIYFSWKVGGFKREMLRDQALTAPTAFEMPDGSIKEVGGTRGKKSTRLKFPQVSPDLSVRWCSAYLKIDVCNAAIRNQERFNGSRTLVVTGERAEESASRAKYKSFEPHKSDNRSGRTKRHVDQYRPVHAWTEQQIWDIIRRYKVDPHPAYKLGWGRVSCAACIFGNKDQWASLFRINKSQVNEIIHYEKLFGVMIQRNKSVSDMVLEGTPYSDMNEETVSLAIGIEYKGNIITDNWTLPKGAFGDSCGPV